MSKIGAPSQATALPLTSSSSESLSARAEAEIIRTRVKFAAKLVASVTDNSRSQALEIVAKALNFETWHALSSHLTRASRVSTAPKYAEWKHRLNLASFLLEHADTAVALDDPNNREVIAFGDRLADICERPRMDLILAVALPLCGLGTTMPPDVRDALVGDPANDPLYTFEVYTDSSGRVVGGTFVPREACGSLVDYVDFYPILDDRPEEDNFALAAHRLKTILESRPDFLIGAAHWLRLGIITTFDQEMLHFSRSVEAAEALIPKGFNGWVDEDTSWFYYDLLLAQMDLHLSEDDFANALKIAEKVKQRTTDNPFRLDQILPFLYLYTNNEAAALKSLVDLDGDSSPACAVARAFFAYRRNDRATFRRELTDALNAAPVTRRYLLDLDHPFAWIGWSVEDRLTLQPMWDYAVRFYHSTPGLEEACLAILDEPAYREDPESAVGMEDQDFSAEEEQFEKRLDKRLANWDAFSTWNDRLTK